MATANTSINPGTFGAFVLLFILTGVFAALVYTKQSAIDVFVNGDPDRAAFKSLPALKKEEADLLRSIAESQEAIRMRERALAHADLEIARHRVYFDHDRLVASVATPTSDSEVINGQPRKVKDSTSKLASEMINKSATRLEAIKTEWSTDDHQRFPALEKAVRTRGEQLGVVLRKIKDQDDEFQKDRAALAEQLEKLAKEKEKVEAAQRASYSERNTKITKLEDEIRKLLGREMRWLSEIEPTANVIEIEESSQRVIIDIGRRERAFPGLLFAAFTFEKGQYHEKGMIEVIEVGETVSVARIAKTNDGRIHPIAKGDYLGNPTFNVRKPKTFLVAGEFKQFNKDDLEGFIRRSGGIIAQQLGPGVDFLVAGERSEPEQALAREYQVLGIKEELLLKFLQPSFTPKTK